MENNKSIIFTAVSPVFIFLIATNFAFAQPRSNKLVKYDLKVGRVRSFSVGSNHYLKIPVAFFNNTKDTLKYWGMSCRTFTSLYRIDPKKLDWGDTIECISDVPNIFLLSPHSCRKDTLILENKRHIKFPITYRIGFFLVTDTKKALKHYLAGEDIDFTKIWSKKMVWKN